MIKPKHFFEGIIVCIGLHLFCGPGFVMSQTQSVPEAYLPQTHFEFPLIYKGQKLRHAFPVQNKGASPLEIIEVKTD